MSDDSEDEKSFLVFKPKHGDESPTNSELVIEQEHIETIPHNSSELDESPPPQRIHYIEKAPPANKMSTTTSTILHDFTIPSGSSYNSTNEFELFSKQIALQLQQLPLDIALDLQMQIHTLVYKKRIEWVQSCGNQ